MARSRFVYSIAAALLALASAPTIGAEEVTMEDRCRREVLELHRFFQDWYNADRPGDAASFGRFEQVLAADFEIVGPNGRLTERDAVLAAVRSGHGRDPERSFAIEIRNLRSRPVAEGLALVTYEEHQTSSGEHKGWQSSALFRVRDGLPNGVEWLHVHETYLPAPDDD